MDERFAPHSDQWAFLASVPRMAPSAVEAIAREATRTGQVVGVRFAEPVDDEETAAPWTRLPSGRTPARRLAGPFPSTVKAVLAQRLFIEKEGLSSRRSTS